MHEKLREIRIQLRRSMNGVAAASMRDSGIDYALNFGVSLPKLKEISAPLPKDSDLANALWRENVREMKILATLLFPTAHFTQTEANQWVQEIEQQEIVEQFVINLVQHLPFANELALSWITRQEEFIQTAGFLVIARLCMHKKTIKTNEVVSFLEEAKKCLDKGISRPQRAAIIALKQYGRLSVESKTDVLSLISTYRDSPNGEYIEFYNDITFDLDYYQ